MTHCMKTLRDYKQMRKVLGKSFMDDLLQQCKEMKKMKNIKNNVR